MINDARHPKISIIIPVYNVEKYLPECLNSLVNQTFKDLEFICINDGSTDNSLEILNDYAKKDDRFIIISQRNQGQGTARNNGIKLANGEYIGFVDPDDWVEINAFEKLYNTAKENNTKILQFNYKEYSEKAGKFKLKNFKQNVKNLHKSSKNLYYYTYTDLKNKITGINKQAWVYIFASELIKNKIEFASNRIAEDHIFSISSILSCEKVYFLDEYLYNYRYRQGSTVEMASDENFCIFDNINLLEKFLKNNGLIKTLEKEFVDYKISLMASRYERIPLESLEKYKTQCKEILKPNEYKKMINQTKKIYNSFEWLFSLKNRRKNGRKYKIITFCGFEFKLNSND